MINTIQNNMNIQSPKHENKNQLPQTVLEIAGGATGGFGIRQCIYKLGKSNSNYFFKNINNFTPDEQEALRKEADLMIANSQISQKGFKGIIWVDHNLKSTPVDIKKTIRKSLKKIKNPQDIQETITKLNECYDKIDPPMGNSIKISPEDALGRLQVGFSRTLIKGSLKDRLKIFYTLMSLPLSKLSGILTGRFKAPKNKDVLKSLQRGNGFFEPFSNRIFISKPSPILHEIGHAINKNTNFLTKLPVNLDYLARFSLAPLAILTAILTKKQQTKNNEEYQKENFLNKTKNFIHNHIGIIVAGLLVPRLIEEGLASTRAIKFVNASKTLSEATKKQHNKALKIAYSTYLMGMASSAVIASVTVFVKDKITQYIDSKKHNA